MPLKWHCCPPALCPPSSYLTLLHNCQHPQGTQRAMALSGRAQSGHGPSVRPQETHTTVWFETTSSNSGRLRQRLLSSREGGCRKASSRVMGLPRARSHRGWSSSLPAPGPTAPSKEAAVFHRASAPHSVLTQSPLSMKMSVLRVKAGKALKRVRREGRDRPGKDAGCKEKAHARQSTALALAATDTELSPGWERQEPWGATARHCPGGPGRSQGSGSTLARSPPQVTSPTVALPSFPGHTTLGSAPLPCYPR